MSNKTLVLYLENETLKPSLQKLAHSQKISVSKYVSQILSDSLKTKQPKNKLLKYTGVLKNVPVAEMENIQESMQGFRNSFDLNFEKTQKKL